MRSKIFTFLVVLAAAALTVLLIASIVGGADAAGAAQCGPRDEVLRQLLEKFGESPAEVGVARGGEALFELLRAEDGSTWTIIVSAPDGASCVVAAGTDWSSTLTPGSSAPAGPPRRGERDV